MKGWGLERWRPRHLLGAWVAYWATLVAVKLGSAIATIVRVTGNEAGKGSVSAGFSNDAFNLTVVDSGRTVYSGHASFTSIALWVAGPPLLLWVAWLLTRPRRRGEALADGGLDALSAGHDPAMTTHRARSEERDAR